MSFGEQIMAGLEQDRDVWWPEWETEIISELGQEWPQILVRKWERNYLGERRFVTSLMYPAPR